jgi:hypothetical protein
LDTVIFHINQNQTNQNNQKYLIELINTLKG